MDGIAWVDGAVHAGALRPPCSIPRGLAHELRRVMAKGLDFSSSGSFIIEDGAGSEATNGGFWSIVVPGGMSAEELGTEMVMERALNGIVSH